jgi:exodeoxyribonuclease VII large subunit
VGGEAQIDRRRRLILERLRSEGILERNKGLVVPTPALRVGLITSKNSAAYNDFTHTLQTSGFGFRVLLAASVMQGENTGPQVRAALAALVDAAVDLICIVRGGGSQVDLAWFDDEPLARAVVSCPIPVWVGIGHNIDVGVLDFVAHTSHKTPTAVAEALVTRVRDLHSRLLDAEDRLKEVTERRLALAIKDVERNHEGLLQGSRKHLDYHDSALQKCAYRAKGGIESTFGQRQVQLGEAVVRIRAATAASLATRTHDLACTEDRIAEQVKQRLSEGERALLRNWQRLSQGAGNQQAKYQSRLRLLISRLGAARQLLRSSEGQLAAKTGRLSLDRYERRLLEEERSLEGKRQRVHSLSPEQVLRRGYSLARDAQGKLVLSINDVPPGGTLYTELADGTLESVVTGRRQPTDE